MKLNMTEVLDFNRKKEFRILFKTPENLKINKSSEDVRLELKSTYGTAWINAQSRKHAIEMLKESIEVEEIYDQ